MAELDDRRGWDTGVGASLRGERIRQGLDLAAIAATLNVRLPFLQAIEDGRYEELPGPTYATGFVRAYAEHLGLDSDQALRQFKLETLGRTIGVDLHFPAPEGERGIPRLPVLLTSVVLLVLAYGAWYLLSPTGSDSDALVTAVPERLAPTPAGEPASVAISLPAADNPPQSADQQPAPDQQPPPADGKPTPAQEPDSSAVPNAAAEGEAAYPPPPPSGSGPAQVAAPPMVTVELPPPGVDGVGEGPMSSATRDDDGSDERVSQGPEPLLPDQPQVVLRALADCWIELRDADGRIVMDRILAAGESVPIDPSRGLSLATGNAGGLEVSLDGEILPALGPSGAVRRGIALDPAALRPPAAPPEATSDGTATGEDDRAVAATAPTAPAPDAAGGEGERIVLRATADTWIEVRSGSGRIVVSRVLPLGESLGIDPRPGLTLITGNAGGLEITLDGTVLPPLGPSGAVRRGIVLTPEALLASGGR